MDDSKIIDLFFERSQQALTELSKKYGAICHKVAVNVLKNDNDAEECVNDAYMGVWNTIPPQRPDSLAAYVFRITRNLSLKKYRYNVAEKRNSYYDVALDELEDCLGYSTTPQDELDAKELTSIFDGFLGELDKTNRIIFVRRYWFSDSIADIAKILNMRDHAVVSRLSRMREKLKQYLIEKGVTI